ncbi:MAG: hypothetical protein KZQ99_06535 [Candidatus Thiodiazotropha sp. (ex Dulcina madagascariensis)]|nr:hypothetical protein [Candidatus Thiodiazotropha sp. (ex Dulcina madagascariensis)]
MDDETIRVEFAVIGVHLRLINASIDDGNSRVLFFHPPDVGKSRSLDMRYF